MKPVLYPKTEKTYVDFGLGEISDALSVEVIRERNGDYSLYMKYPHDGTFANSLQKEMQLKADAGPRTKWQTFDIVRINKKSAECIEVYAKHISFRLEGAVLKSEVSLRNADAGTALALWKDSLLSDTKFDVASDVTTTGSFAWEIDQVSNAREALGGVSGSILDVYGGEYEFDNQLIRLHKQMGRKAPIVLEYGRNIQEIEVDDDDSENYNSILPFAKVSRQEGEKSIDVLTTLPEFYIDGPFIGSYQRRIIKQVDFSSKFDSEKNKPTEDKLRSLAKNYVKSNNVGKPKTTIDVKYVDLASTLDYADMQVIEEVELCDILPLYYPQFGITSANEKVIKTVYDVYNDEYISLTLGTIGQTLRSQLSELTSGKIEALENKQKQFETELPTYLTNASGNRVWSEEPDKNTEHKVGDIWFQNNGLYDRMYIWDGNQWILKIDTENPDRIKRTIDQQFDEFNESYEAEQAKQDQAVKEVLTKATSAEDLANQAKSIGDQAKLDAANALSKALDYKNEAIAEAQRLDTIDRQATEAKVATAKSQAIAEAQRLDTIEREATETKLATTKSQAVAEADKLVNDAKTTLETEISNANQSIAEAKEALESQISGVSTEVTKTNDTIKTLATKTDVDSTNKRLTSAETTIKQQAGQIAQKANQIAVDMLSGRVTKAETSLTQQANQIALKANTSDVNALTNRVTKAEASVKVNASQIALKANQSVVDSVKSRLQNAESSLTVQAKEIAQRVKTSDFNQATKRLTTAESSITQLGNRITTEISEIKNNIPTKSSSVNLVTNSKINASSNLYGFGARTVNLVAGKTYWFGARAKKNGGAIDKKVAVIIYTSGWTDSKSIFFEETNYEIKFVKFVPKKTETYRIASYWYPQEGSRLGTADVDWYMVVESDTQPTDWSPAPEDLESEITAVKTTITQTAEGVKQLSTKVTETDSKISTAETKINQLIGEVSSKVSQTEYDNLSGRVTSQQTAIEQNASEINKRLTSTQVEQLVNNKRFVTSATMQQLVRETAGSFERQISETVAKIPTEIGGRNYILDSQTQKVYSNNASSYPITSEIKTENEKSFIRVKRIEVEKSPGSFSIYTSISRLSEDVKLLEKGIVSFKARASHNLRFKTMIATKKNNGTAENGDNREITISQNWQTFSFSLPLGSDISLIRANPMTVSTDISAFVEDFYLDLCDWKLEGGYIATDWSPAPEDTLSEIESVKTTINQTARGQEQLSTQLTQAQGKITKAETDIRQLIGDVSSKVSQTVFDRLNNTVSSQATTLSQQAKQILLKADKSYVDNVKQIVDKTAAELIVANNAINQRVTQTTFNQATKRLTNAETTIKTIAGLIDTKLSRTDADKIVTNAITQSERGTIQRISEVEGKIPNVIGGRNLLLKADEKINNSYYRIARYFVTEKPKHGDVVTLTLWGNIGADRTQINAFNSGGTIYMGRLTKIRDGVYQATFLWKSTVISNGATYNEYEKPTIDIYLYPSTATSTSNIDFAKLENGSIGTDKTIAPEENVSTISFQEIQDTVDSHTRTISDNTSAISQVKQTADSLSQTVTEQGKSISQVVQTAQGLVSRVDNVQSGISTVQSQLAGSWAVKNLTSARTVLNQINLMANGTNRIDGRLTHITGSTLIDRAVIKDAHIASVSASKMTTGTLDAGKVNVINLNANKIAGLDANFIKSKIGLAIIDWMRGKTISAQNDAMKINLNSGQTLYYTDQAAIKRILSGYPTQFVKFATGTVSGKGNAGVTVIGSNRSGTESSNDGGFVGIRAWNGSNIDQIDVVGDHVRLASSAYNSADGWDIITLPNRLEIDAYNANHRASSRVKVGDVWLWKNASTYSSMRETINLIIDNLQLLHNNKTTEKGYSYTMPAKV
uniref:gp58-like family protein n=1 Tax=Streptococcus pluranimalium TaxID=82348 RepID=UPI003F68CA16